MAYNLSSNGESVRIGNWFEELRLKEETGIRFYPSPKDQTGKLLTQSRCISHTDRIEPKDYTSINRESLKVPQNHPEYKIQKSICTVGPRRKLLEERIRCEVDEGFKQTVRDAETKSRCTAYISSTKDDFRLQHKEQQTQSRLFTKNTDYSTDQAVTFYSHSLRKGVVAFPSTFVGSTNPFSKSSAFSANIETDPLAKGTDTYEKPLPLPTPIDYQNLLNIRTKILEAARKKSDKYCAGSSMRFCIESIWKNDYAYNDVVHISDFETLANDIFGLNISTPERKSLLAAFDYKGDSNLSLVGLTNLLRRSPSARVLELIEYYYSKLDQNGEGHVSHDILVKIIDWSTDNNLLNDFLFAVGAASRESITIDDFFDFYIDAAAEMDDHDSRRFEDLLMQTWGEILEL